MLQNDNIYNKICYKSDDQLWPYSLCFDIKDYS